MRSKLLLGIAVAALASACSSGENGFVTPSGSSTTSTRSSLASAAAPLTVVPTVTETSGQLAGNLLTTAGDAMMLSGDTAGTLGRSSPQPGSGLLVVAGSTASETGTATGNLSDPVNQTLNRVGTLSVNPLLGSEGLLNPSLAGSGSLLDPAVGNQNDGLTSPVTDPALTLASNVTNNGNTPPVIGQILNPVLDPLLSSNNLNNSLLGSINTTPGGTTATLGSGAVATINGTVGTTGTGAGLLSGTGTATTNTGVVNNLLNGVVR